MREREKESERKRERRVAETSHATESRERPNTVKNQAKKFTFRQFSRLLTPAPSLSVFHGNLPQEICGASSSYVYNGREREARERETEQSTLQDHIITMR